MDHTDDNRLSRLAVQVVTTYERMGRNAAYRVLALLSGCITLAIVKLVQIANKEKAPATARREQLHKELTDQGVAAALHAEALEQIRRKNTFFNKKISKPR